MRQTREDWLQRLPSLPVKSLVFVDESSAKTNMTRLHGRSARGCRAHDSAPCGHWGTRTLVGSLRFDGTTCCMSVDGAADGDVFEVYVARVLAPTLRRGDIVVLDNLSVHKRPRIAELLHARGARLLFLPAYSPDFNPIEKMWGKVKSILRALAARTSRALHRAITHALGKITPEDAQAFFESCGYTI